MEFEINVDRKDLTLKRGEHEICLNKEDFAIALTVLRFAHLCEQDGLDFMDIFETLTEANERLKYE